MSMNEVKVKKKMYWLWWLIDLVTSGLHHSREVMTQACKQRDTMTPARNWASCFCSVSLWFVCFLVTSCKLLVLKSRPVSCSNWPTLIPCVSTANPRKACLRTRLLNFSFKNESNVSDWRQRNAACCSGQEDASQISHTCHLLSIFNTTASIYVLIPSSNKAQTRRLHL